jgi:crotonobetaine/carnitine-CoA ligase
MRVSFSDPDAALRAFAAAFAPEERTLPAMLTRQAARYPERALLRTGGVEWSFARALEIAGGMAARLVEAGVGAGDRVALMCGNGPQILAAYLGCAWLGAVAAPINTASRGAQLEHILTNCGARLAVADAELAPQIVAAAREAPLRRLWIVGETPAEAPSGFAVEPMPEPGAPAPAAMARPAS